MYNLIIGTFIGIFAGLLSGIFGIGGGIVMIPGLVFILNFSQHTAQGTTLAAMVLPLSLVASIHYYKNGNVNVPVAMAIAFGFLISGFFGAKIALGLSSVLLKRLFAIFMIFIAVRMFFSK